MRHLFLSAVMTLSIISTGLPVWGESGEVDRRPLVIEVFHQMPGFLDFLYGSEAFMKRLSGGEERVLGGILAMFAEAQWQRSPEIQVEFSVQRDSFKLGGQERTAMTSVLREDPILFNEGLIQNPSFRFEMLDAFQLLVHELARKLPRVNMDDAETLAVKVRTELENYAQTLPLGPHDRLIALTPPMAIQPVRFGVSRVMPLIMIESWGKYLHAPLKLEFLSAPVRNIFVDHESLSAAGFASGNFQSVIRYRVAMPLVQPAGHNNFEISMPLLVEESFSVMGANLDLRPLPGSGMMLGQPRRSEIAPAIRSVIDLKWLYSPRSAPTSQDHQAYLHPRFPSRAEEFGRDVHGRTAELKVDGRQVSGRIIPADGVKTAHLVAGDALIPVTVSEAGEFKNEVEWPAHLVSSQISEILVNFESKIPLIRAVQAPVQQVKSVGAALEEPEVFIKGVWKPIETVGGATLPSRLRLRFKTSEPVLQAQLAWTAPRQVLFDNVKAGEIHTTLWQIALPFEAQDGYQVTEVSLEGLADWPADGKSRFSDSGERVLSEARLVLKSGNVLSYANFSQTFRDRPFFRIESCERSLQTNLSQRKK